MLIQRSVSERQVYFIAEYSIVKFVMREGIYL